MTTERDVRLRDGSTLRTYDTGPSGAPTLVWHHGSPHTGPFPPPLLPAAAARGLRLVTYARPSYGGSTPRPGRDVASAGDDVAQVADALGLGRFATYGHSGGGPHALACAALLGDRVVAAASISGLAPFTGDDAWFAGMASDAALRAAAEGREARARYAEIEEFDPTVFVERDWAALEGPWAALGEDAGRAGEQGDDGLVDDDVAFTVPWGFDPAAIGAPVLLVHGDQDRMVPASHSVRLAELVPDAELWLRPGDGHISVLDRYDAVVGWLAGRLG
ncbi:alpha/beta fold hydrolase [Actinotalea solisilvae]|uniref:alpha/beta fold hydrolase n=1 Tax=Actinotalea solisilvae TaxID=2072922 RepID=UPI0018F1A601|nr:alpha/beta hydrolase [Actinotalea solisilvae]